jgi:ribonuclease-3
VRWDLLELALIHPSLGTSENYEQLEFVGDAVVRLVAANLLWSLNPQGVVGEWSAIRSVLVSDRVLAEIAQSLGVDRFLQVGASASRDRAGSTSRLANAFEALLGALYLSVQSLALIQPWLDPIFQRQIATIRTDPAYQNYKAALQQWTQAHRQGLPEYRVTPVTVEHNPAVHPSLEAIPQFEAQVWLQGELLGVGQGRSRKAAEKIAAEIAYRRLTQAEPSTDGSPIPVEAVDGDSPCAP